MSILKKLLPLLLLPLLIAGCATSTITNLTPSRLPRKANGQYPFSVQFETRQQSLIRDSLKPYVVIGLNQYPMQQTPMLTNRWETLAPVPANQDLVNYRYKFDYEYRGFGVHRADSKMSKPYQLRITNP